MQKTEEDLKNAGFTTSGASKYTEVVEEYCDELYRRALANGDNDKAEDYAREVTHEHVRSGAESLRHASPRRSKWMIASQVGEYLFTAMAGVGGGKLNEPWGVGLFGVGLALATILIVVRVTNTK